MGNVLIVLIGILAPLTACRSGHHALPPETRAPASAPISFQLGGVYAIAASPSNENRAYALNATGVFRTIDGGVHWEHVAPEIVGTQALGPWIRRDIQVHPQDANVVVVRDRLRALWRTNDGGATWRQVAAGVDQFALDPSDPAALLAFGIGGEPYRLRRSGDGGETWTDVYSGCMPPFLRLANSCTNHTGMSALVAKSGGIDLVAGTDYGVYRSVDGGHTWTEANDGLEPGLRTADYRWAPLIAAGSGGRLFAGVESNKIVVSTDGGSHWVPTTGLPAIDVFAEDGLSDVAASPDREGLAAAAGAGLWETIDGLHWKSFVTDPPLQPRALSFSANGVLYVSNGERVWRLRLP